VRILLTSQSRYPARNGGNGASRIHDELAKGLAENGHTVYYSVAEGYAGRLPEGVVASNRSRRDVDIYHFIDYPSGDRRRSPGPPDGMAWVHTCHGPNEGHFPPHLAQHFVWSSRGHAAAFGGTRVVWNGVDPKDHVYSEAEGEYFFYIVSCLSRAHKGLAHAIAATQRIGARLIVAGHVDVLVPKLPNVKYVGYVGGKQKAELLAGAKAMFFPVQIAEPFGLVVAEALMSGTPVIGSRNGSVPELVTPDVGFVCGSVDDYAEAASRIGEISRAACRARAMTEFHYRVMAERYAAEYEAECASS
jgi:glycosyltransferase involved in cell wall biosynthesis